MPMKFSRFLTAGLLATTLLLSACVGKLTAVDYNNAVVDEVSLVSDSIDVTLDSYDATIPLEVGPDEYINTVMMDSAYADASALLSSLQYGAMSLESMDSSQQAAVSASLQSYYDITNDYLTYYKTVLDYYSGDFASDLDKVSEYDDGLYEKYNAHVDAHNALADTLEMY